MNTYETPATADFVKKVLSVCMKYPGQSVEFKYIHLGIGKATFQAKLRGGFRYIFKNGTAAEAEYAQMNRALDVKYLDTHALISFIPERMQIDPILLARPATQQDTDLVKLAATFVESHPYVTEIMAKGFDLDWKRSLLDWIATVDTVGAEHVIHAQLTDKDRGEIEELMNSMPDLTYVKLSAYLYYIARVEQAPTFSSPSHDESSSDELEIPNPLDE